MAATALARLGALAGRDDFTDAARDAVRFARVVIDRYPTAAGQSLIALDFLLAEPREIAVIGGDDPSELDRALRAIYRRFLPWSVVAASSGTPTPELVGLVPWLEHRAAQRDRLTTYFCRGRVCDAPAIGLEALGPALEAAGG
jgi:uncharacterized protein YyaL (SSP411 family)